MKVIIKQGEGEETPEVGTKCKVHYVGTLLDGTKFDSSRDRGDPFSFTIGQGVIKGWSKCAATMKKGEICKVTLTPEYAYGAAGSPPKIPANATLVFEIEMISWGYEEQDLTKKKNGGVIKKKVIAAGEKTWQKPTYEAPVTYKLKISSIDGATTYYTSESLSTVIGELQETKAIAKCLKSMAKKEKGLFAVKSQYAFGEAGKPEYGIPPNADLLFEVELEDFEKVKEDWNLSFEEKRDASIKRKNEGNDLFQKGHYKQAIKKYERSLKSFEYESSKLEGEKKKTVDHEIKLPCYLNIAACNLKLKKTRAALTNANKALEIDSRNVKGLWRQGLALQDDGEWDKAKKSFTTALEVDPENKAVQASLKKLKAIILQYEKKQQAAYKNMFA
eukprot:TRINITY_DN2953_c0_g1_i1.p1 TRINITY_DN2953_c0_g1~~TRINITY_DN2953_c0_g1_i1.p1  ORF type:complete len:415 (+),score=153.71 TRINITY_DN2953_c0_g1_i1:80-1246(+)